jgi:ribosomal protein S8
MNITDPIADMLTRIRNASNARHLEVTMPASNLKIAVAQILKDEGFVNDFSTGQAGSMRTLTVSLKYWQLIWWQQESCNQRHQTREQTGPAHLHPAGRNP